MLQIKYISYISINTYGSISTFIAYVVLFPVVNVISRLKPKHFKLPKYNQV